MKKTGKLLLILSLFFAVLSGVVIIKNETKCYADTKEFSLELYLEDNVKDENKFNLSGIKVDIYSSALTQYYSEYDMSEFTHSYAFSVYSDENGMITFVKPSDEFLMMFDETSLPVGTGVELHTKFYHSDDVADRIEISEIDHVDVNYDETFENSISVSVYNKAGKNITASYSISEEKSADDIKKGTVTVGNEIIPYEYYIDFSPLEQLARLKEEVIAGAKTKSEALHEYDVIYKKLEKSTKKLPCCNGLWQYETFFNSLSDDQGEEPNRYTLPPYYDTTYSLGRFEIRYVSSSRSVPTFINSVMQALQAADTSLCSGLSFTQPRSNESGTAKYYLYVTSDTAPGPAVTVQDVKSGVNVSYTVLFGINDLNGSATDFQKGTIAHEYMHAIVHAYRDASYLPLWFRESWSEWARVRVKGLSTSTCEAGHVNAYLNNSYKSLVSDNNEYGKLLYPLFIKQNYGGDTTVANVVKNLAYTSNVYTAIGNALPGTNTFYSIFPAYMRYVYKPKSLFNPYLSSWNDHAYLSADYGINSYPTNLSGGSINPIAAHYREFAVPSAPYHLDITASLISNYSTFSGKVLMTTASGSITDWSFTPSSSLVTYSTNISGSYVKGCVMFASTNTSSSTTYSVTIARS